MLITFGQVVHRRRSEIESLVIGWVVVEGPEVGIEIVVEERRDR